MGRNEAIDVQLHDRTIIHAIVRNVDNSNRLQGLFKYGYTNLTQRAQIDHKRAIQHLQTYARIADSILYQKNRQRRFSEAYNSGFIGPAQIGLRIWNQDETKLGLSLYTHDNN